MKIQCGWKTGELEIVVTDNGRGFDPESETAISGNGLRNMKQRLTSLGGSVQIDSEPGVGTRVRFRVRIPA